MREADHDETAVLVEKLPGGYNSYDLSVWAVGGRRYVRKRFPGGAERRFLTERRAYELLAESGCRCAPGVRIGPPVEGNELWIEYVDGVPLDGASPVPVARLARAVADYHRATVMPGAYGSLHAPERRGTPRDYWLSHVEDLERAIGRHGLPASWTGAFRAVVAAGLAQGDGTECVLVHRDLRSDNLLVEADGAVRVIDWEIAAALHPAFDLARLFLSDAFAEPSARAEFLEHYGRSFTEDVTRLCEAALGIQLVAYGTPDGELYFQGVRLLEGALSP